MLNNYKTCTKMEFLKKHSQSLPWYGSLREKVPSSLSNG